MLVCCVCVLLRCVICDEVSDAFLFSFLFGVVACLCMVVVVAVCVCVCALVCCVGVICLIDHSRCES